MTALTIAQRKRAELMRMMPNLNPAAAPSPWSEIRKPFMAAWLVVAVFFAGFVGWASFAMLESAVTARGAISPAGSRRTVQHLEGGVIQKILVKDGDAIHAGDTLLTLNNTQADAAYKVTERRILVQKATLARLAAERDGAVEISFPAEALASTDIEVMNVLSDQRNLFDSRNQSYQSQKLILEQQVGQMNAQIEGFKDQVTSAAQQLALIQSETKDVQVLVDKGLERRSRLRALERTAAALVGQKSSVQASIAQAQQKIGEIQMQMSQLGTTRQNEVSDQIARTETDLNTYTEQLRAQGDIRSRTQITAPVGGTVVNLRFKSEGGVIQPGEAILDIVPKDEDLVIEARISPMDIDAVKIGQKAEVVFPSYRTKFLPRTMGEVTYVSADSLKDPATNGTYYQVKVRVPQEEKAKLAKVEPPITLLAGMPSEVFVVTGETSVMSYLLNPLTEMVRRTFRESNGV